MDEVYIKYIHRVVPGTPQALSRLGTVAGQYCSQKTAGDSQAHL